MIKLEQKSVTGFFEDDNDPTDCIFCKQYLAREITVRLPRGPYLI